MLWRIHVLCVPHASSFPLCICLSIVLADLLVSHLIYYESAYFESVCAPTHIVTYVPIISIWEHALFSLVPCAFTLIDTVYTDLTGQ
jgi:hypothetical protein